MKKLLLPLVFLLCFFFISQGTNAQPPCSTCDKGYDALHQKLNLKSDKDLLLMVARLYELEESTNSGSSRNTNASLAIPNYVDAAYSDNKKKVKNIYKHHKDQETVTLSISERIDLVSSFYTDAAIQTVTNGWLECVKICNGIPYGSVTLNTKTEVVVTFVLPYSQYSNKKVKIKKITSSSNLEFEPEESQVDAGSLVSYDNNKYSVRFKRKDGHKDMGLVTILLSKGSLDPIPVPAPDLEPFFELKTVNETLTIQTSTNVPKNWFRFKLPDGTEQEIKFKDSNGNYKLLLTDIKTKLSAKDVTIKSYSYRPKTGGIRDFQPRGVGLEPDNTLNIDIYVFLPGAKTLSGELVVDYETSRLVCVKNCP